MSDLAEFGRSSTGDRPSHGLHLDSTTTGIRYLASSDCQTERSRWEGEYPHDASGAVTMPPVRLDHDTRANRPNQVWLRPDGSLALPGLHSGCPLTWRNEPGIDAPRGTEGNDSMKRTRSAGRLSSCLQEGSVPSGA